MTAGLCKAGLSAIVLVLVRMLGSDSVLEWAGGFLVILPLIRPSPLSVSLSPLVPPCTSWMPLRALTGDTTAKGLGFILGLARGLFLGLRLGLWNGEDRGLCRGLECGEALGLARGLARGLPPRGVKKSGVFEARGVLRVLV